jgi:hypothetical protein
MFEWGKQFMRKLFSLAIISSFVVSSAYAINGSDNSVFFPSKVYITNFANTTYTQCNVAINGKINIKSCNVVTPTGATGELLNSPSGVAFYNQYAYISNANNTYTKCDLSFNGIESATCANVAPQGKGALNGPSSIVFYGKHAFITNANGNSYTQCDVSPKGVIETATCNTVQPTSESGSLSVPVSLVFSSGNAYFTNYGNNTLTKCQSDENGIESDSCKTIKLTLLSEPETIVFNNGYAYIVNGGNNSYTQCNANQNGGITIDSCRNITPTNLGELNAPRGIVFDNAYAYITNHGNNSLTRCANTVNGIDVTTCKTITPSSSAGLNSPRAIVFFQ